jgi:hypothetical protein
MGAVAAGLESEVGSVIEQEGDAAPLRLGPQRVDRAADGVVVDILETELRAGDIAAIQGLGEQGGESRQIVDAGRRDQVKATGGGNETPQDDSGLFQPLYLLGISTPGGVRGDRAGPDAL